MRRVLYVTGTRADFGLMTATLQKIAAHPALSLQIAVTGMHLSDDHGMTVQEIEALGLPIVARIPSDVDGRSAASMALAIGQTLIGLTLVMKEAQPDVVLVLGDRGEMLAGALAGLHLGTVVAHLHGGERSGTVDEPVRHAISKLSHWHFVATEASRERLLRMGERAEHVWVTGAPSLDGLFELGQVPRASVLAQLGLPADQRYLLVLFHPVVQESNDAYRQTLALAQALTQTLADSELQVLWLAPNADAGSGAILQGIGDAGAQRVRLITHLHRPLYAAALRHAEVLVGNSSSGIIEAASFGTPVVNIGNRQRARQRNANVHDCSSDMAAVAACLRRVLESGRTQPGNCYGDGRAGERIVARLAEQPINADLFNKVNSY